MYKKQVGRADTAQLLKVGGLRSRKPPTYFLLTLRRRVGVYLIGYM